MKRITHNQWKKLLASIMHFTRIVSLGLTKWEFQILNLIIFKELITSEMLKINEQLQGINIQAYFDKICQFSWTFYFLRNHFFFLCAYLIQLVQINSRFLTQKLFSAHRNPLYLLNVRSFVITMIDISSNSYLSNTNLSVNLRVKKKRPHKRVLSWL